MRYALAIDWLALYCESASGSIDLDCDVYEYEKAPHGTRQFAELYKVVYLGELFAEVQQFPHSGVLKGRTLIVKFANRQLYLQEFWGRVSRFLHAHALRLLNISRLDICADFNTFADDYAPARFIEDFLASRIRHVGRGQGGAYFDHGARKETGCSISYVNFSGLFFGSRESESRAYLYNKSFELATQGDKPYIRDMWRQVGLINDREHDVWRLEISLKSKAMEFRDKATDELVSITLDAIQDNRFLSRIYFAFVTALWSFIVNREGITNVTREPRIELFNGEPRFLRGVVKYESAGNRSEKILIRQLWTASDTYRGRDTLANNSAGRELAKDLAACTGLSNWLSDKARSWKVKHKK